MGNGKEEAGTECLGEQLWLQAVGMNSSRALWAHTHIWPQPSGKEFISTPVGYWLRAAPAGSNSPALYLTGTGQRKPEPKQTNAWSKPWSGQEPEDVWVGMQH